MPTFTPPTRFEFSGGNDALFSRFKVEVGISVVKKAGHYLTVTTPWLGEIAALTEGKDWFQGGRTYDITDAVATALRADGFTIDGDVTPGDPAGFGEGGFGEGGFGA